ncbi:MAG: TetR/AcrR family transcriptional regulator [Clostridia bacterium]|nr:TetR/AcrR family transcriptional regulator [Clostridia bacterium]
MSSKIDRRVKYTKMVLKNSLIEILNEKPIEKITVKEICDYADINRGTFYSHYSDQFDLYNNVIDELLNGIFERMSNFMEEGVTPEDVHKSIASVYDYIKENYKLVKVLLDGRIEYNIEKRIRDVVKRIYLDKINNVDPELVNTAYSFAASGILGLIKYWINSGMKNSSEEMADFSKTLIVGGIKEFFCS